METENEYIIQAASECLEFLKEMDINDDQISRTQLYRKMKQYENQYIHLKK